MADKRREGHRHSDSERWLAERPYGETGSQRTGSRDYGGAGASQYDAPEDRDRYSGGPRRERGSRRRDRERYERQYGGYGGGGGFGGYGRGVDERAYYGDEEDYGIERRRASEERGWRGEREPRRFQRARDYGQGGYPHARPRDYEAREDWGDPGYRGEDRGFFERAGDEVASWFGDEDAERRRRLDETASHRGRGPRGYRRSDARIAEDVNDRLTDDPHLDASDIEARVENGEVTLDGYVESRAAKRRAEDVADSVSGVDHVQNNLRVRQPISGMTPDRGGR